MSSTAPALVPSDNPAPPAPKDEAPIVGCENVRSLSLEFRGDASEYFRIWIVNLCLTLLTLGIFSPWAKVRKKRYLYAHTQLEGSPFQYLAKPLPILRGRLIAVALFGAYYASRHFYQPALPFVLLPGLVLLPYLVIRSAAFNARNSAYRNIPFQFEASYGSAARALCSWGVAPLFLGVTVYLSPFERPGLYTLSWIAIVLLFPALVWSLKNLMVTHTRFGGVPGTFSAGSESYFGIYYRAGFFYLLLIATEIGLLAWAHGHTSRQQLVNWIANLSSYAGYALGYALVQIQSTNLVWNHVRLGPLRFRSNLPIRGMMKLYLTNALGIVGSLGLLIPWAVVRTLKYRLAHLQVGMVGEPSQFVGTPLRDVSAAGAETLDLFDLDLSI